MPRCSAYQALRAAGSCARKNTPPIPVTRSIAAPLGRGRMSPTILLPASDIAGARCRSPSLPCRHRGADEVVRPEGCTVTIDDLRSTLSGTVYADGDDGFERIRAGFSHKDAPDVVIKVGSTDDVVAGVRYAAAERLPLGVRSGGHSYWGTLPGGLILDLQDL